MLSAPKPFACSVSNCSMTFVNEDHLNVHETNHKLNLRLGVHYQICDNDQTPTPTRFIRNCEEVGLFQDLQNVNPFEETFQKAVELAKNGSLHVPGLPSDESLHTPHFFPHANADSLKETTGSGLNGGSIDTDPVLDLSVIKLRNSTAVREQTANNSACEKLSSQCEKIVKYNKVFVSSPATKALKDYMISTNAGIDFKRQSLKQTLKNALTSKNRDCKKNNPSSSNNYLLNKIGKAKEHVDTDDSVQMPTQRSQQTLVTQIDKNVLVNARKECKTINGNLERIREMNRAAQLKSRQKKKKWFSQLTEELDTLRKDNHNLLTANYSLKKEVDLVKSILLLHKSCPLADDPQLIKERDALIKKFTDEVEPKNSQPESLVKKFVSIRPSIPTNNPANVLMHPTLLTSGNPTSLPTTASSSMSTFTLLSANPLIPSTVAVVACPVLLQIPTVSSSQ